MNASNIIATGQQILTYIPQRPPIVMVDTLYALQDEGRVTKTALTITPQNIFSTQGIFAEAGVLEHVAQSAALRIGYISQQHNEEIKIGYIGSFDKVKFDQMPAVGSQLLTTLTLDCDMEFLLMFSFFVTANNQPIAQGRVKVALKQ